MLCVHLRKGHFIDRIFLPTRRQDWSGSDLNVPGSSAHTKGHTHNPDSYSETVLLFPMEIFFCPVTFIITAFWFAA